jgi:thioredoxin reductase
MSIVETVIVGAGPYGLSIAAHLRAAKMNFMIIGRPMESWRRHMPAGMALKSEPCASNFSDPAGRYSVEKYCAARGKTYHVKGVPLTLDEFLDYAEWFRRNAVPDVKDALVTNIRQTMPGFELTLDTGEVVRANRVIMAVGHLHYRNMPGLLADLPRQLVSHAADHDDLSKFAGKDVTVIGCGQSALESAALLYESGAKVRVLARRAKLVWNDDVVPTSTLLERIMRPEAGLGPGWRNVIKSELPRLFYFLPAATRQALVKRTNGPAGSWWLKQRLIGKVPMLTEHDVTAATQDNGRLTLTVKTPNGVETVTTDHVLAGTGYKVDVSRLAMLDQGVRARITTFGGAPVLNYNLESSVPGLYFVGISSAQSFGPVMRFVHGTKHAAAMIASHLRSAPKMAVQAPPATAGVAALKTRS